MEEGLIRIRFENRVADVFKDLSEVHPVLNGNEFADIATDAAAGRFAGILDMYAAMIARGVGRQIKQGLFRDYIRVREDLSVMHGSLDISGTIRNRLNRKYLISCESDNLSVNNPYNRVLKAVMLYLLRRDEVDRQTRAELKKQVLAFDGIDEVDISEAKRVRPQNGRVSATYMMLMDVCKSVASDQKGGQD